MTNYAAVDRAGERPAISITRVRAASIRNVLVEALILLAFVLTSTLLGR
jgi:hypothetical protein